MVLHAQLVSGRNNLPVWKEVNFIKWIQIFCAEEILLQSLVISHRMKIYCIFMKKTGFNIKKENQMPKNTITLQELTLYLLRAMVICGNQKAS